MCAGMWSASHCLCALIYVEKVCGDGGFVTAAIWCTGREAHDDDNATMTARQCKKKKALMQQQNPAKCRSAFSKCTANILAVFFGKQ